MEKEQCYTKDNKIITGLIIFTQDEDDVPFMG